MKIRVIACCLNEEEMLPFFLDYYTNFADEVIIYDGGSTDNSHNIINSFNNTKLIIEKHEKMDERKLTWIRNNAYKDDNRFNCDWQIIVDIDEFLYHPNIVLKLIEYKKELISIPKVSGYDMYSKKFPDFIKGKKIFDIIKQGRNNDMWQNKNVIFDPKSVNINYFFGCHTCAPVGYIKESKDRELKLLHFNYIGYDHFIKKHKFNTERMSEFNKENNLAYHIPLFAKMTEEEFNKKVDDEATCIVLD